MKTRKFYETLWSEYQDLVCLAEFRQMLGGLGEVQARRLHQKNNVYCFSIGGDYKIPKQCVIDYVLSPPYAEYRKILKAQIP